MNEEMYGEQPPKGVKFCAALGTVAIGLILAGMAIYFFRARPPVVVKSDEEPRYVYVPTPVPAPAPVRPPEPPPAPAPILPVLPVEDSLPAPTNFGGIWRRRNYPLPMFEIYQDGDSVRGKCAPHWSGIYSIVGGKVLGEAVEFAVSDGIFRTHFGMVISGPDQVTIQAWITDDDWLAGFANAQRMARTPQQAELARLILEQNAILKNKRVSLGTFFRGSN